MAAAFKFRFISLRFEKKVPKLWNAKALWNDLECLNTQEQLCIIRGFKTPVIALVQFPSDNGTVHYMGVYPDIQTSGIQLCTVHLVLWSGGQAVSF